MKILQAGIFGLFVIQLVSRVGATEAVDWQAISGRIEAQSLRAEAALKHLAYQADSKTIVRNSSPPSSTIQLSVIAPSAV